MLDLLGAMNLSTVDGAYSVRPGRAAEEVVEEFAAALAAILGVPTAPRPVPEPQVMGGPERQDESSGPEELVGPGAAVAPDPGGAAVTATPGAAVDAELPVGPGSAETPTEPAKMTTVSGAEVARGTPPSIAPGPIELTAEAGWEVVRGDEVSVGESGPFPEEMGLRVVAVEWGSGSAEEDGAEFDGVVARLRADGVARGESAPAGSPLATSALAAESEGRRGGGREDAASDDDTIEPPMAEADEVATVRAPSCESRSTGEAAETTTPVARPPAAPATGEARGVDIGNRVARVLELQDELAAQPVSRVVLRLEDESGGVARVRLGVQGTAVEAEIALSDPGAVDRLQSRVDELSRALRRQGLDPAALRVEGAEIERTVLTGRVGGEVSGAVREVVVASSDARSDDGARDPARREFDREEPGPNQERSRREQKGEEWR